jgi:hypothetical protein
MRLNSVSRKLNGLIAFVWLAAVFSLFSVSCSAQSNCSLRFVTVCRGAPIEQIPCMLVVEGTDSIHISNFQFYVHDIRMFSQGKQVSSTGAAHFLLDAKETSRMSIDLSPLKWDVIDEVTFMIGVDSLTQSTGAHSGALDPILGMYWTWQSGYIHWKLEAEFKGERQNDAITWHIGGYREPFNTNRCVKLPVVKNDSRELIIEIELNQLLSLKNRLSDTTIMLPSKQAMTLADVFSTCFKCKNR